MSTIKKCSCPGATARYIVDADVLIISCDEHFEAESETTDTTSNSEFQSFLSDLGYKDDKEEREPTLVLKFISMLLNPPHEVIYSGVFETSAEYDEMLALCQGLVSQHEYEGAVKILDTWQTSSFETGDEDYCEITPPGQQYMDALVHGSLARIWAHLGNDRKAMGLYYMALCALFQFPDMQEVLFCSLFEMIDVLMRLKEYNAAEKVGWKFIVTSSRHPTLDVTDSAIAHVYGNLVECYYHMGNFKRSFELFQLKRKLGADEYKEGDLVVVEIETYHIEKIDVEKLAEMLGNMMELAQGSNTKPKKKKKKKKLKRKSKKSKKLM